MSEGRDIHTLQREIERLAAENRALQERLAEQTHEGSERNTQADETLRLAEYIIDHSPAVLFRRLAAEKLEDRKMVYVSPNISRFGYRVEDLLSGKIMFRDLVYQEDTERTKQEINRYVGEARNQYSQYYRIVAKDGDPRWVEDRTSVVEDERGNRYHQGIVIDVHERMVAEEKLRKSEEKYRQIVETTCEGFVLMDTSLNIVDCNSACASMLGDKPGNLIGARPFSHISAISDLLAPVPFPGAGAGAAHEIETRLSRNGGPPIPVLIHANTLCSDDGGVIGVMAFITDISEQKKALMLAGEVQKSLLPERPPSIPCFDIAGTNIACEEVGGDYFDYLSPGHDEQRFSVVVGDISGHGVDSALLMSSVRAFLRTRVTQPGTGAEIISALNRYLSNDVQQSGRFMTLFYLHFDLRNNRVEWIRAGHDPALVYHPADDRFEELKGPGLALGVDPDYPYGGINKTNLKDGQIFVVYTDGIWEASNLRGQPYGKERLKQCISNHAGLDAGAMLDQILLDQERFLDGASNDDDVTLVIVKYREPDPSDRARSRSSRTTRPAAPGRADNRVQTRTAL